MSRFWVCIVGIVLLMSIQLSIADRERNADNEGESESGESGESSESEIEAPKRARWFCKFPTRGLKMRVGNAVEIGFVILNLNTSHLLQTRAEIRIVSSRPGIVFIKRSIHLEEIDEDHWDGKFRLYPTRAGSAEVFVEINYGDYKEVSNQRIKVLVEGSTKPIKMTAFSHIARFFLGENFSNALLMMLFLSYGIGLNLESVKTVFKKPYGIAFALILNVLIFPVGYLTFALASRVSFVKTFTLFFSGCTALGQLSHSYVWCTILGANIELSIAISLLNTALSFSLVSVLDILSEVLFGIHLRNVYAAASKNVLFLAVPLLIGVFLQKTFPRSPKFSSIILKWILIPISCIITLFPALLGTFASLSMGLFTFLPLLVAFTVLFVVNVVILLLGKLFHLEFKDRSAIAVEIISKLTVITYFMFMFLSNLPGDFFDILHDTTCIAAPIVLCSHFLWKYLEGKFTSETIETSTTSSSPKKEKENVKDIPA